jgi:hypothetical protein
MVPWFHDSINGKLITLNNKNANVSPDGAGIIIGFTREFISSLNRNAIYIILKK